MSTPKFQPGGDKKEDGVSKKDEKKEEKAEILYDEGRTGPGEKKDISVDMIFLILLNMDEWGIE